MTLVAIVLALFIWTISGTLDSQETIILTNESQNSTENVSNSNEALFDQDTLSSDYIIAIEFESELIEEATFRIESSQPLNMQIVPTYRDYEKYFDLIHYNRYAGCSIEEVTEYTLSCVVNGGVIILYNPSAQDAEYSIYTETIRLGAQEVPEGIQTETVTSFNLFPELEFEMPITFYFDPGNAHEQLAIQKRENFDEAMAELTSKVPSITFEEVNNANDAQLILGIILPREHWPTSSDGLTSTIGKMVPDEDPSTLLVASVYDTNGNDCEDRNVALHELLHAFGVEHNSNFGSLMSTTRTDTCPRILPIEPINLQFLREKYP